MSHNSVSDFQLTPLMVAPYLCYRVKTATVRDLRNRYTSVLRWISAGEDVLITQRGNVIARLSPETAQTAQVVDWASSPEVLRDRTRDAVLSAEQSAEILAEAGGRW
jgi:antitoxin (DNA-binding transcriptional repressor) of toxin-antitoxin stability system